MKTHEYQAKQILRISGVKVPRGILATSPLEAEDAAVRALVKPFGFTIRADPESADVCLIEKALV
jgi:hypothetical protein